MPHFNLRRVAAALVLALLFAFPSFAETPHPALPNLIGAKGQTLVFVVSAPSALERQALGLSLLLQDLFARNGYKAITSPEIEEALRGAGLWRSDRAVLTKDIPYVANSLVASAFIQGRLEAEAEGWHLDLRLYDPKSGQSLDSREVLGKAGDMAWLVQSSAAIGAFWLGTEPFATEAERWAPDETEALTLADLALADAPLNAKDLRRLAELLASFPEPQSRYSERLGRMLAHKIGESDAASPLARALRADVTGDTSRALAAYDALEAKGTEDAAVRARTVALLRRGEQDGKAQGALRLARSREPKSAFLALAAAHIALSKNDWQAAETALAGSSCPSVERELAELWGAKKQEKKRIQALARAAQSAYEHKLFASCTELAAELATLAPERVLPAWLDARYLSESQRIRLVEVLAQAAPSRETLLTIAELLNQGPTQKAAGVFYERAVRQEPYDAETFAKAGRYFSEQSPADRKGPLYLKVALALAPQQALAAAAFARHLAQTGRCPQGLAAGALWAERHSTEPFVERFFAELSLTCHEREKAETRIDRALADFPDDAAMLVLKIRADLCKHGVVEAQMHYERLKTIDKRLAERLGPPKIDQLEIKLAMADGDQEEPSQSALASQIAKEGAGQNSPYKDLEALRDELGEKLSGTDIALDLAGLNELFETLPPGELQRLATQLGLKSDVASARVQLQNLYLTNSGAKPVAALKEGVSLTDILKGIAQNASTQSGSADRAERDTPQTSRSFWGWLFDLGRPSIGKALVWATLLLLLAIAAVLLIYACRRVCGKSTFTAKIIYNRSFHAGHFIGVLNSKKQETDITDIRRGLKQRDAGDWLQAFLGVLFPFKTVAQRDTLIFTNIPPGDYFLTIASVQIDPRTELPIGSIEAYRRVHIAEGQQREDIHFEENVAYIGVRVDSLLRTTELGRSVIVTIEEKPQFREQGKVGEEIALHLPPGEHTIRALAGALTFRQKITVDKDLRSQWVQFRMEDQKCVVP